MNMISQNCIDIQLSKDYRLGVVNNLLDALLDFSEPLKTNNFFSERFYNNKLWIWVTNLNSIICVNKKPRNNESKFLFDSLLINQYKQYLFTIITNKNSKNSVKKTFVNTSNMIYVNNKLFVECLLNIETKYDIDVKSLRIGVLNIFDDQPTRKEWFANKSTSKFEKFISNLGNRILLNKWEGYTADAEPSESIIYNHWRGKISVIYHIAPSLSKMEQRRLIGNDILLIIFVNQRSQSKLDLSKLDQLGKVTQCIAVVTELENSKYYLRFIGSNKIFKSEKFPYTVKQSLEYKYIENIILYKFYNIMRQLRKIDIFSNVYTEPRKEYIESIIKKSDITRNKFNDFKTSNLNSSKSISESSPRTSNSNSPKSISESSPKSSSIISKKSSASTSESSPKVLQ